MDNKIKRRLTKDQLLSIPNIISLVRLAMAAVIAYLYFRRRHTAAAILLAVSSLSDVADGYIARHFNMITDLGKFLDPVADKVTQGVAFICLASRYSCLWSLLVLHVAKEIAMFCMGSYILKKTDTVNGAEWYGKLCSTVIIAAMIALMLFPALAPAAKWIVLVCAGMIIMSLVMYTVHFAAILKRHSEQGRAQ